MVMLGGRRGQQQSQTLFVRPIGSRSGRDGGPGCQRLSLGVSEREKNRLPVRVLFNGERKKSGLICVAGLGNAATRAGAAWGCIAPATDIALTAKTA